METLATGQFRIYINTKLAKRPCKEPAINFIVLLDPSTKCNGKFSEDWDTPLPLLPSTKCNGKFSENWNTPLSLLPSTKRIGKFSENWDTPLPSTKRNGKFSENWDINVMENLVKIGTHHSLYSLQQNVVG